MCPGLGIAGRWVIFYDIIQRGVTLDVVRGMSVGGCVRALPGRIFGSVQEINQPLMNGSVSS